MLEKWPTSFPPASRMELAAHNAITHGFAILPLRAREKIPITAHGCKDATRCHEQAATFFARHPHANLGIATGTASNLCVIDIDGDEGEAALAQYGPIPETVEARTGKGRHLYFSLPNGARLGNTAGKLGRKIDSRGDGGYVVAPPSVHPNGHVYAWAPAGSPDEVDLAELPPQLLSALIAGPTNTVHTSRAKESGLRTSFVEHLDRRKMQQFYAWYKCVDRFLGEGRRNQTAFRIACRALEAIPYADVVETIEDWNSLNGPPLSHAEIQDVINSAAKAVRRGSR